MATSQVLALKYPLDSRLIFLRHQLQNIAFKLDNTCLIWIKIIAVAPPDFASLSTPQKHVIPLHPVKTYLILRNFIATIVVLHPFTLYPIIAVITSAQK
jgi:hypothetical protein